MKIFFRVTLTSIAAFAPFCAFARPIIHNLFTLPRKNLLQVGIYLLLINFLLPAYAVDKYVIGSVHTNFLSIYENNSDKVLYKMPLPPGEWQLSSKELWRNKLEWPLQRISLIRVAHNRVNMAISFNIYTENNLSRKWSDELCKENAIYKNSYNSGIWEQECLIINPHTLYIDTSTPLRRGSIEYVKTHNIKYSTNAIALTYTKYGGGKSFTYYSYIFPEIYGFENPQKLTVNESPYHYSIVKNDLKRKQFIDHLINYGEQNSKIFSEVFKNGYSINKLNEFGEFLNINLAAIVNSEQLIVDNNEFKKTDYDSNIRVKSSGVFTIEATAANVASDGMVVISVQASDSTTSLKINDEEQGGNNAGKYTFMRLATVGKPTIFTIIATDNKGNIDSKILTVLRSPVDSVPVFQKLNPASIKEYIKNDAVAIIIGIEKYKRVAKADYANADAQDFYDYAIRALGIKPENIKLLFDDGADDVEIYKAFQNWLPIKVNKNKTDVYVFYSGHGYPGLDGNSLYMLPYGADKDLISKTAINQQEIITTIQNTQPRTVTMFFDSCYSGQTRGGDVLIAGARPIATKISANSYPPNFTVISASANDQISSASPDLKHGIFSYYLMKGMEGDADLNKDGKITVGEMQEYLTDMVGRQAMGMNRKQQPQLFGDSARVLVGR